MMRTNYTYPLMGTAMAMLCCSVATNAQNLVPNPGFEVQDTCPAVSQIMLAPPWGSASLGTPDLFNSTCSTQNTAAHSGVGSSGVYLLGSFPDNREYLEAPLTSPLVAGQGYCVSFWVKRSNFRYASDRIGAYFSDGAVNLTGTGVLPNTPQVENPAGNVLLGNGWHQISGGFVANGGEDHIIIGSFALDAQTDTVVANSGSSSKVSYYVIDDVSVTSCAVGIPDGAAWTEALEVFPQPAEDHVMVRCASCAGRTTADLMDAAGAQVRTGQVLAPGGQGMRMDLSGLSPGLYLLRLTNAERQAVRRVVVQ